MRFPQEDLGRIRRGEITATLRPYENRPSMFHPADRFHSGLYVIELVRDVREVIAREGVPPLVIHFEPPKVDYRRVAAKTDPPEYIEITARTKTRLGDLTEDDLAALGYDDLDELIDVFCTDRNLPPYPEQQVWLYSFAYTTDAPLLLATPNWSKYGHDDYVAGGKDRLTAEPEAVDRDLLKVYAGENHDAHPEREQRRRRRWERRTAAERADERDRRAA